MALYPETPQAKPLQRREEGGSRKLRARAIIFMVVALGAGLAAAWMVTRYVARNSSAAAAVPVAKVVIAAVDLPLATSLKRDMLKVVDWPVSAQPQGSFDGVGGLEGRVTGTAVVAGEAIVETRLAAKGSGAGMAALIPPNMRAMTVQVNTVIGVSGFIHPGDLVDVIATIQAPRDAVATAHAQRVGVAKTTTEQQEYRSKIVLQNIRVLAVGTQLVTENNKPESVPAVTLLVSPEESERLALASTQGKVQLTMRSQVDSAEMATPGVSPLELLAPELDGGALPALPIAVAVGPAPRRAYYAAAAPAPAAPAAKPVEVVEVMRGDKLEERKVAPKGTP